MIQGCKWSRPIALCGTNSQTHPTFSNPSEKKKKMMNEWFISNKPVKLQQILCIKILTAARDGKSSTIKIVVEAFDRLLEDYWDPNRYLVD